MNMTRFAALVTLLAVVALPATADTATRTSAFDYDAASGLLVKEIVEPGDATLCVVTTYVLDGYGNKNVDDDAQCNGSNGVRRATTAKRPPRPGWPSSRRARPRPPIRTRRVRRRCHERGGAERNAQLTVGEPRTLPCLPPFFWLAWSLAALRTVRKSATP